MSLFTSSWPVGSTINPTQSKPVAMFGIYVSDVVMFFQNMEPGVLRLHVNLFAFNNLCASSNPKHLQKKSCPCQHGLDYSAISDKQGEHCGMFHEVPPDIVHVSTPLACMP